MPLYIIREDITRLQVDAIVTAGSAGGGKQPDGGVNGRVHQKAGSRLLAALRRLGGVRTGGATLTEAFDLPCRYVIHTAGPIWQGGRCGEEILLRACYQEALELAAHHGFGSIAFPLISTGRYGYPKAEALQVATDTIRCFLDGHDLTVYLVVYSSEAFRLSGELYGEVEQYIDEAYVREHASLSNRRVQALEKLTVRMPPEDAIPMERASRTIAPSSIPACAPGPSDGTLPPELIRRLKQLDEGFRDMLLRLIDERGIKDSACYNRANVDRKLFNKIRNNPGYKPKKTTVTAFCIALELPLEEAREMLGKAGYSLNHASAFDVVVEYFITHRIYDVDRINRALFDFDMPLLGSDPK